MNEECKKYKIKSVKKTMSAIDRFCIDIERTDKEASKASFKAMPEVAQCLFLQYGWQVLSAKSKYSGSSYRMAKFLFSLFTDRALKGMEIYAPYLDRKIYAKKYQRYETPDDTDSLYLFYTSLYEQRPDSQMALKWLVEHGVYDGKRREKLVERYKKG